MNGLEHLMGARAAAEELGVHRTRVYQLVRAGALEPVRTDIGMLLRSSEVHDLRHARQGHARGGKGR